MQRNPTYFFSGRDATGIFDVPLESMILIDHPELNSEEGDLRILVKVDNGSMTPDSTVGEFIDDPRLWREGIGQRGPKGKDGIDGVDGRHGVDGKDGIDGFDGAKGDRGDPGSQGIQGISGLNGNDGKDGRDGIDGKDGANGADGREGAEGPQGKTGPRGPQGDRGDDGIDGKDGTGVRLLGTALIEDILTKMLSPKIGDLWLANNTDHSASVPGIAGDGYVCVGTSIATGDWDNVGPIRGPMGKPGHDGKDGTDGVDGVDGQRGKTGNTGPAGIAGGTGKTGPQGERGPRGHQGEKGDQGDKGERGDDGIDGKDGRDGIDGILGAKGDTGPMGPIGPKGKTGDTGPQGETGAGVTIKGVKNNFSEIAKIQNSTPGDVWIAGDTGHGWVSDGAKPTAHWSDIGKIHGPTGPRGPKGEPGQDGRNGTNGRDGTDGVNGARGPKGDTGARGATGPKGDTGARGPVGPAGAPSNLTARQILDMIKTVDGAGSGLDADLLDGRSSNSFASASHNHSISQVNSLQAELNKRIQVNTYAKSNVGGTVKMRVSGATLYITNNGSNA